MHVLRKEFFREIKSSRNRYLSLLFIVALGVAFFSGVRSAEPDMQLSADDFFDETNFMDIRVLSTLGVTDGDIAALRQVDGVMDVEPICTVEALAVTEDHEYVLSVSSLTERISTPHLVSGRLPEAPGECLMDDILAGTYALGDTITLSGDKDADLTEDLTATSFTITGFASSPSQLNFSRGTASIGNGSCDGLVYLLPECFLADYYTAIYVTVAGAAEEVAYTDAYQDRIETVVSAIEEIEDARCAARYEEVVIEANDAIAEGEQELADAKAEADEELSDALAELSDGEQELADAKATLAEKEQELMDGKSALADGEQELIDGKAVLADGWEQYRSGMAQWQEQADTFAASKASFEEQEALFLEKQAEFQANETALAEGYAAWEEGKATLEENAATLTAGQAQLTDALTQLDGGLTPLTDALAQLDSGLAQVAEGLASLAEAETELEQAEAAYGPLPDQRAELEAQRSALETKQEELTTQRSALETQQDELTAQRAALTAQLEELNTQAAQLEAARTELAEKEEALTAGKEALEAARPQITEAAAEIEAYRAQLTEGEAKLAEGLETLQSTYQTLCASEEQLEAAEEELAEARSTIRDGEQQLADGQAEIADAEQELADGWQEYHDGKAEAEEKIADAEQKLADARAEVEDLEYPEWYVLDRETIQSYVEFGMDAERIGNVGKVFPAIFFLVAALVSLTTMTRMVEEERTQIGTLKALGYSQSAIAGKYMMYAFSASVFGSILGVLVGSQVLPQVIIAAYRMLYGTLTVSRSPIQLDYALLSTAIAVLCTSAATWAACHREFQSSPAELMRPAAPKQGKRIFLERITFFWKRLSFTGKSTLRNLIRYKKRFFMTIFGIGGCMALLMVGFGLRDSIAKIVDNQYKTVYTYQASLGLDSELDHEELLAKTEAVPEIHETLATCQITKEVKNGSVSKDAYLFVPQDLEAFPDFVKLRSRTHGHIAYTLNDTEVIITEKLARMLDVGVGDTFLLAESETESYEVTVGAITENYMYHYVYMTPTLYESIYHKEPEYNELLLRMEEISLEREDVLAKEFLAEEDVLSVSYVRDRQETVNDMMRSLDLVVCVLIVSAGLLAFVVLYNLNNINITERRRELATLKVLGFYDGEVAEYVYRENVFLTILGIFTGIVLGIVLHRFVIQTVEIDMLMFGQNIMPPSYLYSSLLTVVFSVLVNFSMFYKLKKIDMIESLKSVE